MPVGYILLYLLIVSNSLCLDDFFSRGSSGKSNGSRSRNSIFCFALEQAVHMKKCVTSSFSMFCALKLKLQDFLAFVFLEEEKFCCVNTVWNAVFANFYVPLIMQSI